MKKIPVPQASEAEIADLVCKALSFDQSDDYDVDLERYSQRVMGELGNSETMVTLYPRALLAFTATHEHKKQLLKIGAMQMHNGALGISGALFHAAAHTPLKISVRSDETMKLHYETLQFINLAKHKAQADGPPVVVESAAERTLYDDGTLSPLLERVGDVDWSALATPGTPFQFDPQDWPEYENFRRERHKLLATLDDNERAVFCQLEREEGDPVLTMAATMLADMPQDLCMLAGIGPWSLYPSLEDSRNFCAQTFTQVALRSPKHVAMPCEHGELPVHIFTRLGMTNELCKALHLDPATVNATGLLGQTPLMHAIQLKDREADVECLLSYDPNLYFTPPSGHTYMRLALDRHNWHAIDALLAADYPMLDDPCCDQRVVRHALNDPDCPSDLRIALSLICDDLPEISEFSAGARDIQRQLSEMMTR